MSKDVVDMFYTGLASGNGEAMASCYSETVRFEDPAFGVLEGQDAKDMWRMLCANSSSLQLDFTVREVTESAAEVDWVAKYTFSSTGRPVTNKVHSKLLFDDGKIISHLDTFDVWSWSSQALGLPGKFLGWAPPFQKKVRSTARAKLQAFQTAD